MKGAWRRLLLSGQGGSPPCAQCVLQRYTSTQADIMTFRHWHFLFLSASASPPLSPVGCGVAPPTLPPSSPGARLLNLSHGLAALFPPRCHNLSPRHRTCIINLSHSHQLHLRLCGPLYIPCSLLPAKALLTPLPGSILLLNNWRCVLAQWKGT